MLQLDQKYCIISGAATQEKHSLAVIFIPIFKEGYYVG